MFGGNKTINGITQVSEKKPNSTNILYAPRMLLAHFFAPTKVAAVSVLFLRFTGKDSYCRDLIEKRAISTLTSALCAIIELRLDRNKQCSMMFFCKATLFVLFF